MGGKYDSSRTRVAPVFSELRTIQSGWLRALLKLPIHGASTVGETDPGSVLECVFGDGTVREKRLPAPPSLLRHLVERVERPKTLPSSSADSLAKRDRLFDRDPATVREALDLINRGIISRGWHVFEGPTAPDVYIATSNAVVVIEGKRTEAGPTTDTTWMVGRHQMWRHIDAAWETKGTRKLFGFFVVEGDDSGELPDAWREFSLATISESAIESSLPHRTPEERAAIQCCFLGVTTWQKVTDAFGLPRTILIDKVE